MRDAQRIYELMVLTAWADGKVQAEEALAVHRIVVADPAFAQVGNKSEISRAIQKRISENGLDASLPTAIWPSRTRKCSPPSRSCSASPGKPSSA